jgi:hypothetical protein
LPEVVFVPSGAAGQGKRAGEDEGDKGVYCFNGFEVF